MTEFQTLPHLNDEVERIRWKRALHFAIQYHGAQKRRYTGEPYWYHLANVGITVSKVQDRTIEMIEAAALHDVLEDTDVTVGEVEASFGPVVAHYVQWVTDTKVFSSNREKRKIAEASRLLHAPNEVKTIKLADMLDNVPSIVEHDSKFARVYVREKINLLPKLAGGDQGLWQECATMLHMYEDKF